MASSDSKSPFSPFFFHFLSCLRAHGDRGGRAVDAGESQVTLKMLKMLIAANCTQGGGAGFQQRTKFTWPDYLIAVSHVLLKHSTLNINSHRDAMKVDSIGRGRLKRRQFSHRKEKQKMDSICLGFVFLAAVILPIREMRMPVICCAPDSIQRGGGRGEGILLGFCSVSARFPWRCSSVFTLGRVFPLCQINGGFCCGSGRVRIGFGSGSGFAVLDNIFVIFIICLSFFLWLLLLLLLLSVGLSSNYWLGGGGFCAGI